MSDQVRHTARQLPVMIGNNDILTATADIYRSPDKVLIQITSEKRSGQLLAEFLEQEGRISCTFSALPVQNMREKRETN